MIIQLIERGSDLQASTEKLRGSPPIPPPENRVYYPALDGLRAFAAVLVFCEHYLISHTPGALEWGWVGVDIFFVLSGFLITGILLDTVDTPHRFRNFYVRRTLRIFPLYYGVFLCILLLTPVLHWEWSKWWLLWFVYLGNYAPSISDHFSPGTYDAIHYLFSRNTGIALHFIHFWSLSVEEQFYLLWPLVVYRVRRLTTVRNICIAVICIMPAVRIVARSALPSMYIGDGLIRYATFFRLDGFLVGGLIATLLRGSMSNQVKARAGTILGVAFGVLLAVWGFAARVLHEGFSVHGERAWLSTVGFSVVDFIAAGLLLLALRPGNPVYQLCMIKPIKRLGQVSYGFYVFHAIPIEVYQRIVKWVSHGDVPHIGLLVAPIAFLCTTGLALLSFRYFESPFLRLKARFTV